MEDKISEVLRLLVHPQVAVQVGLTNHVPNLALQHWEFRWVQGLALVMFVHQLFQPGNVAIAVSGGHGRYQVIDNRGVGPAFGLGTLTRVVDDKRIEQRHIFQGHLRVAGIGKSNAFAGKPLHGAVLAHVNHGVRLENVPDPAVIGHVMVGWGQVWAVIYRNRVLAKSPGRLQSHKHVTQVDTGDG